MADALLTNNAVTISHKEHDFSSGVERENIPVSHSSILEEFECVEDFEKYAFKILPNLVLDYYRSGSYNQLTLRNNKDAFQRLRIRPNVLVNIENRDARTKVLGYNVSAPIGASPCAMQKMAHPDGEIANARAAGLLNTVFILSTFSNTSLEDVAAATPNTIKWFQVYIYNDRNVTKDLVQRAEGAGYLAIIVTVDGSLCAPIYALKNFKLPSHLSFSNFSGQNKESLTASFYGEDGGANWLFAKDITWNDILWLKTITKLPIVLKGILTAEDAIKAANIGVAGVMVSNHGGRQLDTVPASIEALPEIARAVGDRIEVYLDGGVRHGADVFKAIALGAKMVFVGRPLLWGMACNGENGARQILNILIEEFKLTLGLTGCNSVADIKKSMVVHESYYHKLSK